MPYPYNPATVPPSTYSAIPEGEYNVIIEHAEEKRSKAGNEMMELVCVVQGPERAGAKLWDYIVYDDKAARKFRDILRSCGLPDLMQDIRPELFEGACGRVKVKHELDKQTNERRAKLHYWIEAEQEPEADMDTPPPPSASDEPVPSVYEDKIPF